MGQGELEELRRQIDDMIDRGWIRPGESEFGATVLFVLKKGGKLRMCIDYRGLNRITRKNAYPLPRIDDLLDAAGGCKVFSKIDLKSGYHQIEVDPSDQHKTAFKTRDGLYEFIVMPFGLTNAPATFQSLMDKVLCHQLNRFVVVYLDDILIFSKSMEEHLKHLEEVLQVLKEAQLHLNLEKSEFGRDSVIYLGHRLSANGLEPEATKVEVIRNWPEPANVRELRSFLGLASYYRKFVPIFFVIAHPLSRLTSKNVVYAWCEKCETAFQALKEALVSHPVPRIADPNLTFVVTTDASQFGIGAVLQQDDGDGLRLLEYYNKRMPSHKVATSRYMCDLYALRKALTHWKHYLLGRHFKIFPVMAIVSFSQEASVIYGDLAELLVQHLSRPVASTLANKELMVVTDYVKDVVCTFSYGGGELNNQISFLVSDDLPFDMLGMYYLEVAKPQFDWDKKVLKHKLPDGRTVRLTKYKASGLLESYGCLCASAFYNYYKQNQEEGMYGLYEFVVTSFGLCNASGTFQHAMNRIFHDYLDKFVVIYLADILVFSKSVEEHAQHLEIVLSLLRQHKYKVNLEKCEFGRTRILYLGHEVSAAGIRPKDAKVASRRDWPRPQTITEVRSFLGMCSYYRNFVKNYSTIASPLTDLTRLDTPWEWSDECEAAFKRLKHALMNHEVLMVPGPQKPFIVTTDASQYGIGAVRAQQDGKKLRPIEYMSKKMPSKKLAKSTYEREFYALYKALVHWRHFLLRRFFYLRTDHQTLKWIKTQPALFDALKLWIEVIDQYDFKLEYLKGEYNKVADALSRRADYQGALVFEFGVSEEVTQSLVGAYQEDPVTMDIIHKLQAKDKGTEEEFVMVDGLLVLRKAGIERLVVPSSENLRSLFLGECHDATGHFGYKTSSANLVQRFWWPGMLDDAKKYVETCQVCQRDNPRTQAPLGLLKPLPIPAGPGQSVSMDFMDTLVTSRSGKRHIFVIIGRFTKYARLIAMPETATTEHIIKLFMDNWVRDFGLPKTIVSDRDLRFTSELWKKTAEQMGSQLQMTSENHPEAN
ncbi:hypothetical protein CBR_g3437 [Chara braunii]|uniref:Reverse transcriptase domain-containing protein n=1 Tax=Chara braunii TaxID=69332 RepID=A0A388JQZ5_CHABU|nr:hypothetical protein CBR_g3437 [Chara braunii]|eukprot:GBG60193.1 hypothetical protein CBR_g3437 [Chara braunii]